MKKVPKYRDILDKISFVQILGLWVGLVVFFGVIYFLLNLNGGGLLSTKGESLAGIQGLLSTVYFSFITATSTGYGDIVPIGLSRFFSLIEVILGLFTFGILVSKLVSVKQETILQEVYDISFDEKINRIRSALYLFRSDVNKLAEKAEHGTLQMRRVEDMWMTFTSLESTMYEVSKIVQPQRESKYLKNIDDLNLELVITSIGTSLVKAKDLLELLDEKKLQWRTEMMSGILATIPVNINNIAAAVKKKEPNKKITDKMEEVVRLAGGLKEKLSITVEVRQ